MAITRREDAASIIDDEDLVDELDKQEKALTGKSDLIVKAKSDKPRKEDEVDDDKAEIDEDEEEEDTGKKAPPFKKKSYVTLSEALTQSPSRYDALCLVEQSTTDLPADEQLSILKSAIAELGNELMVIKSAAGDLYLAESIQPERGNMTPYEEFVQTVQTTLQGEGTKEEKAATLQTALNGIAQALKAELDGGAPEPTGDIAQALKAALTPLTEQISMLNARLAQPAPTYQVPVQRSFSVPVVNLQPTQQQLPVSPITGQPSQLTAQIRAGMGLM